MGQLKATWLLPAGGMLVLLKLLAALAYEPHLEKPYDFAGLLIKILSITRAFTPSGGHCASFFSQLATTGAWKESNLLRKFENFINNLIGQVKNCYQLP